MAPLLTVKDLVSQPHKAVMEPVAPFQKVPGLPQRQRPGLDRLWSPSVLDHRAIGKTGLERGEQLESLSNESRLFF